jgi:cyclopropane fatty-acyl-phospholipid synthase-like methyltransferase
MALARNQIQYHYDLGNDFYALFLDPSMTYSSAVFEDAATDLASAQLANHRMICRKLPLGPTITCWRSAEAGAPSRWSPRMSSGPASPA